MRVSKWALIALAAALVSLAAAADGFIIPSTQQVGWLTIVYHRVVVRIEHGIAITHVDQEFRNDYDFPVEGTYIFPLPEGASVQKFTLWVNGSPVEGKVLPADEARQLYLDFLQRNRDPALLEYVGRGAFQARVFPIPPGESRRIELEYVEVLSPQGGVYRYRYPLDTERFSASPLEKVQIQVELTNSSPLGAVYSPSHQVTVMRPAPNKATVNYAAEDVLPDRDFYLYYSSSEEEVGLTLLTYARPGEDGWFLLIASPALVRTASLPKDIVLVLDKSGSMEGKKIEQAKAAAGYILKHLGEGDRFGLIAFNEQVDLLTKGLVEATPDRIAAATAEVKRIYAGGWTNIHAALLAAMGWLRASDRPQYVIFLTDGIPTAGETDTGAIVRDITAANSAKARLFVFGVGDDVDPQLLDLVAQKNRGIASYVSPQEDLEGTLTAFYEKIAQPAFTDLDLAIQGPTVYDLYPRELPDLFYGGQLILVGRYTDPGPATITLSGVRQGKRESYLTQAVFPSQDEAADFLPRLWASRKVGYLLKQIILEGESEELVNQIVELATRYGIATPYTSFLAEEQPSSMAGVVNPLAMNPRYAQAVPMARSAQKLAATEAPETAETVKEITGRVFLLVDDVWQESTYKEGTETLDIEYLSPAYFELLSEFPDLGPILALGEKVIFRLGAQFIRIGENGLRELTPEQISRLKGK